MCLQMQLESMMLVFCNRIIRENLVSSSSKEDKEPKNQIIMKMLKRNKKEEWVKEIIATQTNQVFFWSEVSIGGLPFMIMLIFLTN